MSEQGNAFEKEREGGRKEGVCLRRRERGREYGGTEGWRASEQ